MYSKWWVYLKEQGACLICLCNRVLWIAYQLCLTIQCWSVCAVTLFTPLSENSTWKKYILFPHISLRFVQSLNRCLPITMRQPICRISRQSHYITLVDIFLVYVPHSIITVHSIRVKLVSYHLRWRLTHRFFRNGGDFGVGYVYM